MKPQLVIIQNPENEQLIAAMEEIYLKEWIKNKAADPSDLKEQYKASQEMALAVNHLDVAHPQLILSLREKTFSYIKKLRTHKLRDHLLNETAINKMNFGTFLLEAFIIYLGIPVYGLALLLNFPPYFLAKKYSDNNIKNVEFYASVCSNMAMMGWLAYYAIQLIIVGIVVKHWMILGIYAMGVPLLGYFAICFYPVKQKIMGRWRLLRLVRKNKNVVSDLINERRIILQEIQTLKKTADN